MPRRPDLRGSRATSPCTPDRDTSVVATSNTKTSTVLSIHVTETSNPWNPDEHQIKTEEVTPPLLLQNPHSSEVTAHGDFNEDFGQGSDDVSDTPPAKPSTSVMRSVEDSSEEDSPSPSQKKATQVRPEDYLTTPTPDTGRRNSRSRSPNTSAAPTSNNKKPRKSKKFPAPATSSASATSPAPVTSPAPATSPPPATSPAPVTSPEPATDETQEAARKDKARKVSVYRTDSELRQKIKAPIVGVGRLDTLGWTYVMQVQIHGKTLVKIGCTKDSALTRAADITAKCGKTITVDSVDDSGEICFCERAEELSKLELRMKKFDFACSCNTTHKEFFDVDYDTAVRVVRRWSTFCAMEPYGFGGQLRKTWRNRLRRKRVVRPALVKRREAAEEDKQRETAELMRTWDDFVYVSWTSDLLDDLQVAVEHFNKYHSPAGCMLLTLLLLQLWPNSSLMLLAHVFCILWFQARNMTDHSSLSSFLFRKAFNVALPWKEHLLSSLTEEVWNAPASGQEDLEDHLDCPAGMDDDDGDDLEDFQMDSPSPKSNI